MLVCGIHDGHNAAAALVADGRLLGALQEERLTRCKNQNGFPERAIDQLLRAHGASWGEVDAFVFAGYESYGSPGLSHQDRAAQIRAYKEVGGRLGDLRRRLRHLTPLRRLVNKLRQAERAQHLKDRGVNATKIFTVEHHRCHATTAYYGAGIDTDALVITVDGAGDGLCATVSVPGQDGRLNRLASVPEEDSLGILWALITSMMGMVPLEHEYKLMGMAPYANGAGVADITLKFGSAFEISDGVWRRTAGVPEINYSYRYWRDRLEFSRFDFLCAGLQTFTEEIVPNWVRHWLRKTGRRKLRLSGGVFMNVKLNKILGELPEVDDLYVFPSCGDETNAIGAAWVFLEDQGLTDQIVPVGAMYLGVAPSTTEYERAVEQARELGANVAEPPDPEAAVATLLADGRIVAHFDGREEFGARALGSRSILADPSRPEIVKPLNRAIKCRDFWMPFAASVMSEYEETYINNPKRFAAPYMILAFDSKHTEEVRAACHPEDRTVRPQVVYRNWNPRYYRILELFQQKTGRGAVLNTSFNIHGEPIVSSPMDAVDVLKRSGLSYLAIGPYLVSKANTENALQI